MPDPLPESVSRALTQLDAARRALAEVRTIDEAKRIRDQAEAVRHYLCVQQYGQEAQNDAAEIKLRAERRLGELLAEMPKRGAGRPSKNPSQGERDSPPRLAELGIDYNASHRWQRAASLHEERFERHVAEVRANGQELTTTGVLRLAKAQARSAGASNGDTEKGCTLDDLHALAVSGRRFGTVYADPPWAYGNQATRASTGNHYRTMTVGQIADLPVKGLAAEDAHLHLWTTNAFLFECPRILEAWGFTYKSVFVWCKPQMGIGNYWRVSHEFLLLGVRGRPDFRDRGLMSWAALDRGEHSSKPEQVRLTIEKASPPPYLELFGRRACERWTVWGNQIERDLFNQGKRQESDHDRDQAGDGG